MQQKSDFEFHLDCTELVAHQRLISAIVWLAFVLSQMGPYLDKLSRYSIRDEHSNGVGSCADHSSKRGGIATSEVLSFFVDMHSNTMYHADMLAKELVAASTEPLILSLLSKGENYGYALIQEIKRLSGDEIEWTDGMLYPVLHRMEQSGWIKSRWVESENGRKRKYYSIKKDGQHALKEKREQWGVISSVFNALWEEQHV